MIFPRIDIVCLLVGSAFAQPKTLSPILVIRAETQVAAMPDRRYIFGRSRGSVAVWSALSGKLIASVPGQGASIIDKRNEIAIVGSEIWDLHKETRVATTSGPGSMLGVSPNRKFAIMEHEGQFKILSLQDLLPIGTIRSNRPSFFAFSKDSELIALGRGKQFDVYDVKRATFLRTSALAAVWPFKIKGSTKGFNLIVGANSVFFLVVYERPEAHDTDDSAQTLYQLDWGSKPINMFMKSPTGGAGLGAKVIGNEVLLHLSHDPAAEHAILRGHQAQVTQFSFSPDRWTMATGDKSGEVRVWDTFSGHQLAEFKISGGEVSSLNFSPDAQFLLAANWRQISIYPIVPSP